MKTGEKVQFVTGKGPIMTVTEVLTKIVDMGGQGKGNILCKWWDDKDQNFKKYYFMTEEIYIYKKGPGAIVT